MKNIVLFLSVCMASGLLLTNIYTSLIDARSWGSDIPNSIGTAREYFKTANPGNFFRLFSPLNQVLALLALLLCWKFSPETRVFLGIALVMFILTDVFTFAYFYPRNDIMFGPTALTDIEVLKNAWKEWAIMNWVRSGVLLTGLIFSGLSMYRVYAAQ